MEHLAVKVWTELLKDWDVDYEEETLLDLVSWTKKWGMEPTKETALVMNNWTWTGKHLIDATLKGNQSAVKILRPWSFILKLLKLIKSNLLSRAEGGSQTQAGGIEQGLITRPHRPAPAGAGQEGTVRPQQAAE